MAGDPVIGRIQDERAADLASGPRDEDGAQDWFATRLSTQQPSGLAGSVDTGHPTLFTQVRGMVFLRSSDAGSCIVPMPGRSQEPKMYGYPMVIPAEISPTATRMISHLGGGSCGPRLISLSYLRTPYATTDATSDPAASALLHAPIHRSAWKEYSANFGCRRVSEVRS
jgi:hypothetical protein